MKRRARNTKRKIRHIVTSGHVVLSNGKHVAFEIDTGSKKVAYDTMKEKYPNSRVYITERYYVN